MLQPSPRLDELNRRFARARLGRLTYGEGLRIYAALWREAQALDPDFPDRDWRSDLGPDLAVARALNGLTADA